MANNFFHCQEVKFKQQRSLTCFAGFICLPPYTIMQGPIHVTAGNSRLVGNLPLVYCVLQALRVNSNMQTYSIVGAALLLALNPNFFLLGYSCFSGWGGGGYKRRAYNEGRQVKMQGSATEGGQGSTLSIFKFIFINLLPYSQQRGLQELMQKDKEQPLAHLLAQQANAVCFQCGKASKQWGDLSHAIFLCLGCAALFKQLNWVTKIKSIGLDTWEAQQIQRMQRGGNESFKNFLTIYGLQNFQIRTKITSKAAAYYRGILDGKDMGVQPTLQVGRQVYKQDIPLNEMSAQELLQSAKEKALYLGSKTISLGEKGIKKIQQKYQSGELKEGAKKVATSVSTGAKWLWGTLKQKVGQIAKDIRQ